LEPLPGDLFYPREKVSIFVDQCLAHGCPQHSSSVGPEWREVIEANAKKDAEAEAALVDAGWTALRFWDCEIVEDPKLQAEQVLIALRAGRDRGLPAVAQGLTKELGLARIARVDATTRMPFDTWKMFLEMFVEACRTPKGSCYKKDLQYALCGVKGWKEETFKEAWDVAAHHNIIEYDTKGTHQGLIMAAALIDAGIRKGD
jgi:hypothetical protein